MRFDYDGISMWYGTPDAPAPREAVLSGIEVPITIGVWPADASNKVEIRYRVNQGSTTAVQAKFLRTEPSRRVQYFRAQLPALRAGDRAEYSVICRCAGRQVPNPENPEQWSSFTVAGENDSDSDLVTEASSEQLTINQQPSSDTRISTTPTLVQNPPFQPELAEERELFITREIIGQLIDNQTNEPLSGYGIRGSIERNGQRESLGYDIANGRGYFSFTYALPESESGRLPSRLFLEILNSDEEEITQTTITIPTNPEQIIKIPVAVPIAPEKPSPALTQVANLARVQLPTQLLSTLANKGIRTLADLQKAGGLNNIPELGNTSNSSAVQKLEAQANLNIVSDDLQLNTALIDRGFTSISRIAQATRADFVSAIGEQQGDFKAAQLQVKARAQTNFLNNIAASVGADLANGLPNPLTDDSTSSKDVFKPTCSCQSCEAATSPLAYLADLLDFSISKVKNNNTAISFEYLANTFHQSFGELPVNCEIQQQSERQVRLCVEVLRSYLSVNPPTTTAAAVLEQAEKQYALNVYQILLNQIGTSYDELRQTRGDTEAREALAKRLGIALDKLNSLFLDPDGEVTEANLERIFGFKATKGFGKKQGDPLNQVVSWQFQGVELGQNTDPNGYVYLNLELIRGIVEYVWTVNVFKDRDRTELVARGSTASTPETSLVGNPADRYQGTLELNAIANSGLTGTVTLDYQIDSNEITIFLGDESQGLLNWRLEYLRTLWQEQDWSSSKTGDPLNQVVNWEFQGVELEQNTDSNGYVYLNLEFSGGIVEYVWTVEVFSDRERTQLVARGSSSTAQSSSLIGDPTARYQGTIELNAIGNSGLTGTVSLNYQIDSREIAIFLGTRAVKDDKPPIIDPDLIGLAYLTNWSNPEDAAYQLWQARTAWLEQQLNTLKTYTQDTNGLDELFAAIASILGIPLTKNIVELYEDREKGNDISSTLDNLNLSNGGFLYLVRVRNLLASDNPVLSSEWEEVYNIFLQALKIGQFNTWREQERNNQVLLSPDSFQIPVPPPLEFPPPEPQPLPQWRATQQALRNWENKLQSRIEREQTIKEGLQTAISATEEATLPLLRDALIIATDVEGNNLNTKADWITKNLLIDAQAGSCQETTRIAQAIETIQGLLWGLKINQFRETYPNLELGDRETFDEKWKWLGSYANWRSAMFVFLYPENILRPELRKYQTPAFRQLVKNVRNNRRLTPDRACQEAKAYSDYFEDIAKLKVEATCQTSTRIHTGDCRNRTATIVSDLFYMFARGAKTNTVYWSTYNPQDTSGYAQSFWETVPGLETEQVLKILGAAPYSLSSDERFIYLFVHTQDENQQKLKFITYNLQTQNWEGDLQELELPENTTVFSAVVEQRDNENFMPHIVLCIPGVTVYLLYNPEEIYNSGEIKWREIYKNPVIIFEREKIPLERVFSLISFNEQGSQLKLFFLFCELENEIKVMTLTTFFLFIPVIRSFVRNTNKFLGAFLYPGTDDKVYAFYESVVSPGPQQYYRSRYKIVDRENIMNPSRFSSGTTTSIATHNGQEPNLQGRRIAYNKANYSLSRQDGGAYHMVYTQTDNDDLKVSSITRVVPKILSSLLIREQISDGKLHFLRRTMENTFKENEGGSQSNLTYLKEAYYFVPIFLALKLQQHRYYQAALNYYRTVYAYNLTIDNSQPTEPKDQLKIYYGLKLEESLPEVYQRAEDWLLDPLNPHVIAANRRNTYTRFTLLSITRCFLEYADNEFTRDTAESVPRARTLYLTALELLERLEQKERNCKQFIDKLDTNINNQLKINASELIPVWHQIKGSLLEIEDEEILKNVVQQIEVAFTGEQPWITKLINAQTIIDLALNSIPPAPNFQKLLEQKNQKSERIYAALLNQTQVSNALKKVGDIASKDYLDSVSLVSGITTQALETEKIPLPWLRQKTMATAASNGSLTTTQPAMREDYQRLAQYNPIAPSHIATLAQIAKIYPLQAVQIVQTQPNTFLPSPIYGFCLPLNPVLDSLRLWAELNLYKLRTCRNIAGIERKLEPYAASTDILSGLPQIGAGGQLVFPGAITFPATPYRYAVIIERAKQLVSIAQQIEASFLSALEKLDAELYNLLKARQDIQLTRVGVRLQDLRVREAESGVTLAELQKDRSQIQVDHFQNLLDQGLLNYEKAALGFMNYAVGLYSAAGIVGLSGGGGFLGSLFGSAQGSVASGLSSFAAAASTTASIFQTLASYERRKQEWQFQEKLAQQDVLIGEQQIRIAQDRVRVVGQERVISQIQADFAEETLDFLTNKFTNAELYDWMVGILEGVYSFFLQQATATAKLAEDQLAFERQEVTPSYIQADYWEVPNDNFANSQNNETPDRRGLTGSARLLQDIYQLDQYAFETDQRKLQLSKTISLARLAPAEFQGFRETGVMLFSTPMELFDRDFPGHYLRLIKRVRTTIIALIPPNDGIKATLSTTGLSRVVTGQNNLFQTNEIARPPESVALTSPRDATGLFELTPQSQEMLLPFENLGVDTSWELRLPKASNLFDYNTIADVLITIEYTALNSFTYRQTVLDELGDTISGDRPFSFRNQFADAWYDLNNPEQTDDPMIVTFETTREDFPANIEDLTIQHIVLYFARLEGETFEVPVEYLHFTNSTSQNDEEPIGGGATTIDGVISTRRGNPPSWSSIIGKTTVGQWELNLTGNLDNGEPVSELFANEKVEDILFVITYSGRIPQ